jgi:hypothetical protein
MMPTKPDSAKNEGQIFWQSLSGSLLSSVAFTVQQTCVMCSGKEGRVLSEMIQDEAPTPTKPSDHVAAGECHVVWGTPKTPYGSYDAKVAPKVCASNKNQAACNAAAAKTRKCVKGKCGGQCVWRTPSLATAQGKVVASMSGSADRETHRISEELLSINANVLLDTSSGTAVEAGATLRGQRREDPPKKVTPGEKTYVPKYTKEPTQAPTAPPVPPPARFIPKDGSSSSPVFCSCGAPKMMGNKKIERPSVNVASDAIELLESSEGSLPTDEGRRRRSGSAASSTAMPSASPCLCSPTAPKGPPPRDCREGTPSSSYLPMLPMPLLLLLIVYITWEVFGQPGLLATRIVVRARPAAVGKCKYNRQMVVKTVASSNKLSGASYGHAQSTVKQVNGMHGAHVLRIAVLEQRPGQERLMCQPPSRVWHVDQSLRPQVAKL